MKKKIVVWTKKEGEKKTKASSQTRGFDKSKSEIFMNIAMLVISQIYHLFLNLS